MTEMVVINGIRYKPVDAAKVGGRPDPEEHTEQKPARKRRPANKARKPPEPVETETAEA